MPRENSLGSLPARTISLQDDRFSIGIRIAENEGVTMKYAVAAVLFATMAAAPVTSIACVGWCFPAATPTSSPCHHASTTPGIKGAEENCDSVLAISPFLKEETQIVVQAVLPASALPGFFTSAPGEARLASGRDVDTALTRGSISPLVLRL